MSLNLCWPDGSKSCAACCGLYNLVDGRRSTLLPRLEARTRTFAEVVRDPDAIAEFAVRVREQEAVTPLDPVIHVCEFVGFTDAAWRAPGCMLHPTAPGNRGVDFRGLCHYGSMACKGFFCPATEELEAYQAEIVIELIDDWHLYGLVATDVDYVKSVFRLVEMHIRGLHELSAGLRDDFGGERSSPGPPTHGLPAGGYASSIGGIGVGMVGTLPNDPALKGSGIFSRPSGTSRLPSPGGATERSWMLQHRTRGAELPVTAKGLISTRRPLDRGVRRRGTSAKAEWQSTNPAVSKPAPVCVGEPQIRSLLLDSPTREVLLEMLSWKATWPQGQDSTVRSSRYHFKGSPEPDPEDLHAHARRVAQCLAGSFGVGPIHGEVESMVDAALAGLCRAPLG
ncbi:MAG: hypothetical protein AB1646_21250 [Thermodesulfobacteriota bacterium]